MGGEEENGREHGLPELPGALEVPEVPEAPEGSQQTRQIDQGLERASHVVDTVGRVASAITSATHTAEGGGGGIDAVGLTTGVAQGAGGVLAGVAGLVDDAGAQQVLGVSALAMTAVAAVVSSAQRVEAAITDELAEHNRHRVTFRFESHAMSSVEWGVASFTVQETIGRPYVATVVLSVEDLDVDPHRLLGDAVSLTLARGDDHERVFGGIVRRIERGRTSDRARVVTIEIVPALDLLSLRKDSRIFQLLTVLEIIDLVLDGPLGAHGRELELRTNRTYLAREHCVQYGETDLDFVTRLMEEEGLTYFFEWSSEGVEKMIIVDAAESMPNLLPDGRTIPFVEQRGETSDTEHVHELLAATQLRTTSFALSDLDWSQLRPNAVVTAEIQGQDANGVTRARYDHDRAVTLGRYREGTYGQSDASTRLATRREAHVARERVLCGTGNVLALSPGRMIDIEDHPIAQLDGRLLVLTVTHSGHRPEQHDVLHDVFEGGAARYAHGDVSYECSFEAIPASVTYRMPETTPKPRVHGMLSAVVVGDDGQEIHSDPHRRVRIQMRWDREGTFDPRSSPYVRVMQTWAGAGFGSVFLPRVGMEVAVAFLDGDPDRPMIAGCLYDQDNHPPYTSEEDWTKSTLRTKSTPDPGDGDEHFNELRFEDAAGSEEVFLHAEKDLNEVVKHDHTTHVRRHQTQNVDGNQRESVGGTQHVHVHGDRYVQLDESEETMISGSRRTDIVHSDRLDVHGDFEFEVFCDTRLSHHETRTLHVGQADRESYQGGRDVYTNHWERKTVQGDSNKFVHGKSDLQVDTHHRVVKGGTQLVVADGIFAQATGDITLVVGENRISISPSGDIRIYGKQLSLSNGLASIKLTSSGEVDIIGPAGVNLACGSNSVSLSPSGVSTSGTSVSSTAIADHTIVGAIVRIN